MEQANAGVEVPMEDGGKVASMNVEPEFSGKPEDFAKDMELIRKAAQPAVAPHTVTEAQVAPEAEADVEPAKSEATPRTEETPQVPKKFQDKDGKLDEQKLEKATLSLEQRLAKYLEMEKELGRKSNAVKGVPAKAEAPAEPADPFEAQVEADIQKFGAGKTLTRLFHAAKDAARAEVLSEIEGIKLESELGKRERELRAIAKSDPWVLSEKGMETLAEYRKAHPWINSSPAPWTEAYKAYLGDQAFMQRLSRPVDAPNPKGAKVPPAPIRATETVKGPVETARLEETLKNLTPEQEDAFWQKMGFPPIHKKRR